MQKWQMWLFFHIVSINCNALLPTLSQELYTDDIVKLVTISETVVNLFHRSIVTLKVYPCNPFFSRPKRCLSRCKIWTISRMGEDGPSQGRSCLSCVQAGVKPGVVMKEKHRIHVSVSTSLSYAAFQFH